ncbi:MAG: galactokinase [Bacteroidota bacterium]
MEHRIIKTFNNKFDRPADLIVKSPGRINIIGEHTDYNEGFVLPAAIDYAIYFSMAKSSGSKTRLYSADFKALYELDKNHIAKTGDKWVDLCLGVIEQLSEHIGQFDVVFGGNIPKGAGLSSSAALCCGLCFGLSRLFDLNLDKWCMARIAQKSEHTFGGTECGIMDQFACLFGMTNHVLELDCKTNFYQPHEFDLSGYRFLLIDSGITHALEASDYNTRKHECKVALDKLKYASSEIASFQDVSIDTFLDYGQQLTATEFRRAKHVIMENYRVGYMIKMLRERDFVGAGKCLLAGHKSLKSDFEITCMETDFLVRELMQHDVVLGARQVGGGFGGCVLAITKDLNLNNLFELVKRKYRKRYKLNPRMIPVRISGGCDVV